MDESSVNLRQALPTFEEGLLFASYLDQAAEGFFSFMLGRHFREIIARAYLQPGHDLSYQNVNFALLQDRVVGMISGYMGEQHHQGDQTVLKRAAGAWNLRMRIVSILFAPLIRILDTIEEKAFYIQAIAIDSNLRGQGIGTLLLDLAEKVAWRQHATKLALDVSAKNAGARRLYEHHKYVVDSCWPRYLRLPVLTFYRMNKPLNEPNKQ